MTNVINNNTVTFATTNTITTSTTVEAQQQPRVMSPLPQRSSSSSSSSEYVAVILAGSIGTRLYPITNDDDKDYNYYIPKHMLPIGGIPILLRLLNSIELCGFVECVLLLKHDDTTTMDLFLKPPSQNSYQHPYHMVQSNDGQVSSSSSSLPKQSSVPMTSKDSKTTKEIESLSTTTTGSSIKITIVLQSIQMKLTIVQYDTPCTGTVDALRRICSTTGTPNTTTTTTTQPPFISNTSHIIVFPSDLVIFDTTPIRNMIHEHRCGHGYNKYNNSNYNNKNNNNNCMTTIQETTSSPILDSNHHDFITNSLTSIGQSNSISTHVPSPPSPSPATLQQGQSLTVPKPSTNTTNTGKMLPVLSTGVAANVLLIDVTAMDESTLQPIYKESAKQKKGLLSREEDDVFYMAIQSSTKNSNSSSSSSTNTSTSSHFNLNMNQTTTNRLIWKQSKFDVEEDKEQIGTTPKVKLPKFRLYAGGGNRSTMATTQLSTEWNDVHCYCISSWVLQQLCNSQKLQSGRYQSIQYDLIPLLISRQYRGVEATFHNSSASSSTPLTKPMDTDQNQQSMHHPMSSPTNQEDKEYMVLAHVSNSRTIASSTPSIFRSHTITSYLFANRVMAHELSAMNVTSLHHQQHQQQQSSSATTNTNPLLSIPTGTTIQSKFHTILLPECNIGEKVTFKSCVIGHHCIIGNNCRLNNVVLHDHVTIGDNTTLQGTIVSAHVTIGSNCNFNDCQILHHMNIPSNTKKKGEAITSVDE